MRKPTAIRTPARLLLGALAGSVLRAIATRAAGRQRASVAALAERYLADRGLDDEAQRARVRDYHARLGRHLGASPDLALGDLRRAPRPADRRSRTQDAARRPVVRRRAPLTAQELAALLAAVSEDEARVLYGTAARTRLSLGELLALRWGDVDLQRRRIRVERSYIHGGYRTPKRGARQEPIGGACLLELHRHREQSAFAGGGDLVFGDPASGRVQNPHRVRRRLKDAAIRAGLPGLGFHQLSRRKPPVAVPQAEAGGGRGES